MFYMHRLPACPLLSAVGLFSDSDWHGPYYTLGTLQVSGAAALLGGQIPPVTNALPRLIAHRNAPFA
jgi:hypothetical protein